MRKIKFRSWDKDNKKMIRSPYDADFNVIKEGEFIGERFIIMLYTGLEDKNGKEIYEGDIVRWKEEKWNRDYPPTYTEHSCLQEVIYERGEGGAGREVMGFMFNGAIKDIEVIGNIYENKTPETSVEGEGKENE